MLEDTIEIRGINSEFTTGFKFHRNISDYAGDYENISIGNSASSFETYSPIIDEIKKSINAIELFNEISKKTNDEIKLLDIYGFFPVIIGNDQKPIPLYSIIEIIDGMIDYEQIIDQIPTITLQQIQNTFDFLRKLTSINIFNADIDEIENSLDLNDSELIHFLTNALNDEGKKSVLYHDK